MDAAAYKDWLINLLHNDEFMMYMQEEPENYLLKEEFFEKTPPCGIDPDIAWELISFMRRMTGTPAVRKHVPTAGKTPNDLSFWSMSANVIIMFNEIVMRTGEPSQLWASLEPLQNHGRMLLPFVEDLTAAAFRDGLEVDYEDVRALVFDERTPRSPSEQVIANAYELIKSAGQFSAKLDGSLLEELQSKLLEHVDSLPSPHYELPNAPVFEDYPAGHAKTSEDIAQGLSDTNTWGIHPLFSIIMDSEIVFTQRPFKQCNGLMEIVLRNILLLRIGIPGLRFVPLSKLRLDWERGLVPLEKAPFRYGWAVIASDFGIDSTPFLLQIIRFIEEGVDRLENMVAQIEKSDGERKDLIMKDYRLSHRQKELVCAMIDDPHLTAEVGSYAERFDIATSTARDDLNRLVALKLCFTEFRGKKQVFWARPDMEQAIEQFKS